MRIIALLSLVLVASCGADGAPTRPEKPQTSGITISGQARVGVVVCEKGAKC